MPLPITTQISRVTEFTGEMTKFARVSVTYAAPDMPFRSLLRMVNSADQAAIAPVDGDILPLSGNNLPPGENDLLPLAGQLVFQEARSDELAEVTPSVDIPPVAIPMSALVPEPVQLNPVPESGVDQDDNGENPVFVAPFLTRTELTKVTGLEVRLNDSRYAGNYAVTVLHPISAAPVAVPARAQGSVSIPEQAVFTVPSQSETGLEDAGAGKSVASEIFAKLADGVPEEAARAMSNPGGATDLGEILHKPNNTIPSAADVSLSLPGVGTAGRALSAPGPVADINIPLTDEGWGQELNNRVLWMAGKNIQQAEIRLNPAELGQITIKVFVDEDVAKITFTAQHALTREAIETALPRLREMFVQHGLSVAEANVSDAGTEHEQQTYDESSAAPTNDADVGSTENAKASTMQLRTRTKVSLVDTFV